jgi:hypothetical protein
MIFVLIVCLVVISHVVVEARHMNDFKQLMLKNMEKVRKWAQNYLDVNNLPYQPSEDYP